MGSYTHDGWYARLKSSEYVPSSSGSRSRYRPAPYVSVPLVASLDEPEEEVSAAAAPDDDDDAADTLKPLGVIGDEAQAMLIRRLLDEAEIPSVVQGGHAPQIGQCTPWRIFVDEDYFASARETLASYQSETLLTGQLEGVIIDPVYEGKSMAGLIDLVTSGEIPRDSTVLYAHLGGQPALNAYSGLFTHAESVA